MKKLLIIMFSAVIALSFTACSSGSVTVASESPSEATPSASLSAPAPTATLAPTPSPTIEPSPTPSSFLADTPDSAGSGTVLFDIYESRALVDLNGDGTDEEIIFDANASDSTLYINGTANTIAVSGLAQLFAVTNVDTSDNLLELVFTDEYASELADTEFASSYLYWWNGSALVSMGALMDVKFAGAWRSTFDATKYFKANGEVYYLANTSELTDLWYMKQCKPDGSDRKLKEVLYATKPLFSPEPLTIRAGKACLLLAHGDSTFFGSSYAAMWDYAGYPHNLGRAINPTADIVIIAQAGETLTIVGVLGPNWVKLQTSDGYKGWIKVDDGKVQGYSKVMHFTAADIFDGIVIAG